MKNTLLLMLIPVALQAQLIAEKYFTFGAGYSETIYGSKDLDQFKKEYNEVNNRALVAPLEGFNTAEGVRFELGYWRVARWSMGLLAGAQFHQSKDGASFTSGQARNLSLKMNTLFVDYEMGRTWDKIFVHGLCTVSFNRGFVLKSDYKIPAGDTTATPRLSPANTKPASHSLPTLAQSSVFIASRCSSSSRSHIRFIVATKTTCSKTIVQKKPTPALRCFRRNSGISSRGGNIKELAVTSTA